MATAGLPLTDVMHYGRWQSFSSFKLYTAKGEVLLTRLKQEFSEQQWENIETLSKLMLVALRHSAACSA